MFNVADIKSVLSNPIVIALFLAPYLLAFLFEHKVTESMGKQYVADSVFNLSAIYQKLITAGPRELRQNYTVLVDIDPVTDKKYRDATNNTPSPCGKEDEGSRNALAKLLNKIDEEKPAEIVVDKYFPETCSEKDPGTNTLKNTLQRISKRTPIVIGRRAVIQEQLNDKSGATEKIRMLMPSQNLLKFADTQESKITEGIVNLDPDNRKLALKWSVRPDKDSDSEKTISTLSFAAVKAYYENQSELSKVEAQYPRIKSLLELNKNPYISFIEPEKFELIPAGTLIAPEPSDNFSRLRGKIVIIGESANADDKHDSVFGRQIAGFILQANYIEAMLDQRYFKSVIWLDYALGFLVFVIVYFAGLNISPIRQWRDNLKLLVLLVLILCGIFLLLYLSVVLFGIYINPITISMLAIVIIITHHFFPKPQHH